MKLSQFIKHLQRIQSENGELEVFVLNDRYEPSEATKPTLSECEPGDFPRDWNMPEKYVTISD